MRPAEIKAKNNSRVIVFPRQIAMYLAKHLTDASLPEIGRQFGGKHHTTVLHSVEKIEEARKTDKDLNRVLNKLTESLGCMKPRFGAVFHFRRGFSFGSPCGRDVDARGRVDGTSQAVPIQHSGPHARNGDLYSCGGISAPLDSCGFPSIFHFSAVPTVTTGFI